MKKHNGHKHPSAQPIYTSSSQAKRASAGNAGGSGGRGGSRQGNIGHEKTADEGNTRQFHDEE